MFTVRWVREIIFDYLFMQFLEQGLSSHLRTATHSRFLGGRGLHELFCLQADSVELKMVDIDPYKL